MFVPVTAFAVVEVAWVPIFVVWFGYGVKTIVLALIYVVFFPVLYNTLLGVRTAPQIPIRLTLRASAGNQQVLAEYVFDHEGALERAPGSNDRR